jgi:hypothetical protein
VLAAGAVCTLGGILICIVAASWHNISLEITHSRIMVIGPGWLFNWTSSIGTSNRISGLVTLSSNNARNKFSACEGFSVNVTNSTINITEVIGVSVMFVVQHFAASPLRNIHVHLNSGSTVALSSHRDASMCEQLKKYDIQLAVPFYSSKAMRAQTYLASAAAWTPHESLYGTSPTLTAPANKAAPWRVVWPLSDPSVLRME